MHFVYFLLFVFKFKKISYVLSFLPFPISLKLHALYYVQIVFQLKLYRTNLKFPDPETTDPLPNFYERNFARYRNQIPISKIIFLRNLPSIIPVPISNNRESTRESSTISQAVVNFRKRSPIRAPYCRVPFEYYNFLP